MEFLENILLNAASSITIVSEPLLALALQVMTVSIESFGTIFALFTTDGIVVHSFIKDLFLTLFGISGLSRTHASWGVGLVTFKRITNWFIIITIVVVIITVVAVISISILGCELKVFELKIRLSTTSLASIMLKPTHISSSPDAHGNCHSISHNISNFS